MHETSSPLTEPVNDLVIIGLGYVGLPLAATASKAGIRVTGLDRSQDVVDRLNAGRSHVDDIADEDIQQMQERGFAATIDPSVIGSAQVVVICVPTPLSKDGSPDLAAVIASTRTIGANLRRGTLVVLESTTYPGTTEDEVRPILEANGFRAGEDFYLAFSPERVDPGNKNYDIKNTPKVVGGSTPACSERATRFYAQFVDRVVTAKGTREAETAKLLENTYRHINIALVNEMAKVCHELDIDLWDVIRCASTKPFGFQAFYPGPGVGGHCIPIDPNYLSYAIRSRLGYPLRFVELAQEINATMPGYVARRVQDLLNEASKSAQGSKILLVGVTYKANIADQRESPADAVAAHLLALNAEVWYHDPYVPEWTLASGPVPKVSDLHGDGLHFDAAVILQHHDNLEIDRVTKLSDCVLDTRGATDSAGVQRL